MLVDVYSKDGQQVEQIELRDDVFGIEPSEFAMQRAVVVYLAHQRSGTHSTKTRSFVSGGGRKPWRQKGRGTARAGSTRSPIWIGGGTIHGPQPHKYNLKIPKKMKQLAKKSALSLRCAENNLFIVEDFTFEEIKTKQMIEILNNLKLSGEKILVLLPNSDDKVYFSGRNIPKLTITQVDKISTYDILNHKKLLLFKGAIESLMNAFNN